MTSVQHVSSSSTLRPDSEELMHVVSGVGYSSTNYISLETEEDFESEDEDDGEHGSACFTLSPDTLPPPRVSSFQWRSRSVILSQGTTLVHCELFPSSFHAPQYSASVSTFRSASSAAMSEDNAPDTASFSTLRSGSSAAMSDDYTPDTAALERAINNSVDIEWEHVRSMMNSNDDDDRPPTYLGGKLRKRERCKRAWTRVKRRFIRDDSENKPEQRNGRSSSAYSRDAEEYPKAKQGFKSWLTLRKGQHF